MQTFNLPVNGPATLNGACIVPEQGQPKAVVVLVHGMAEHKERYFPFMTFLAERGYASVITDLRGHGASVEKEDDLGYFGKKGADALVEDVHQVITWAKMQFPGLKLFLFGHSMGSLVVRCYLQKYDDTLDGLLVCGSPSDNPAAGGGIFLTRVMQLFKGSHYRSIRIAKMMFGPYEKKFRAEGIRNAWLSTNKGNVQAYNNDPLCGFLFTLNGYRTVMQLIRRTYHAKEWKLSKPTLPVHFVAGAQDPCIVSLNKFSKAVASVRSHGYAQVTSKVYPGMRHEILNETGREDPWRDLAAVMDSWL